MSRIPTLRLATLAAAAWLALAPVRAEAQKALVYCPVGIDAAGCNTIVAALAASSTLFPDGVDAGYDGTSGTVDLAGGDLSGYAVFVVPSLADGPDVQPYSLLRNGTIAGRLQSAFVGRVAVWSGTPDVGSTNRTAKDGLIRNLAAWAKADGTGSHGPGVVALQDNSDDEGGRYGWLGGISVLSVGGDPTFGVYANVQAQTSTGQAILTSGGLQFGYTNMASYGLVAGAGGRNDATGDRVSQVVLVTAAGDPSDPSIATVTTDKEDYSPGDTVTVTGTGWEPGETVSLLFHENVDPPIHPDETLSAVADDLGHILNREYGIDSTDIGVRFTLTATGQTSGRTAQATFTDNKVLDVALAGAGLGTVTGGAPTGISCPGDCTESVDNFANITLSAAAAAGSTIGTWSVLGGATSVVGCTTGSSACAFNMNNKAIDVTVTFNAPDLTVTKTHSGTFTVGTPTSYSIVVKNSGTPSTSGLVTMTDVQPSGLTFSGASGTGWSCSGTTTIQCTRSDALAAGASYPAITLNVTPSAAGAVTNTATVSGGNESNTGNNSASDPVTVLAGVDLTINKSHSGNFTHGTNGTYTLAVSNGGSAATTGTITVTDALPTGLGFVSATGTNWSCGFATGTVTCTRTTAITAGNSAPNISLVVTVDAAAIPSVTNTASVSGGGEPAANNGNNSDSDPTTVGAGVDLTINKSHSGNFTEGVNGSYTLTVTNGGGAATSGTVTVTDVLPAGLGFVSAIGGGTWTCGFATGTVTCTRTNAINPGNSAADIILTVSVAAAAAPGVTNTASVSGGGEPAANNGNNSDSDPTTVTIVNAAPVLGAIGNKSVDELVPLTFTATATDANAPPQTLAFSLDAGFPAGASITTGGAFSWTPTEAQGPGVYPVTIRVSDGTLNDFETISITVNEVNLAPAITGVPATATIDELDPYTFDADATDGDSPVQTLTFSLVGAPAGATINGSSGVFDWTPTEAQGPDSYSFSVRVSDGVTHTDAPITITVNEVNVAPTISNVPATASVDELVNYTFDADATDPDVPPQGLTFSLVGAPTGATINSSTGAFSWTPSEVQGPDTYTFTVRVSDGTDTDDAEIAITVNEVNLAPELPSIGNQMVDEETLLSFSAAATDADLPANTLTYSLTGTVPTGATINASSGAFSWTPTEAQGPGSFTFTLSVTDDGTPSLSDQETITVTVKEVNKAPVVDPIADQIVDEETELTFTATADDPDIPENAFTFGLIGAPAGASIDPTSGVFSWTPTEAQGPGDYTFEVGATDDGTPPLTGKTTVNVHVDEVNRAPVLQAIGDKSVDELVLLGFTAAATDEDLPANTLTYSLVGAPAGASINASSGAFTWTPTEAQGPNTYTFTVKVADNGNPSLSDEEQITVTVREVNVAPVLAALANYTVDEGQTVAFTATATDADIPANPLTFSLTGTTYGASITSGGAFSWVAPDNGSYTFTVRVTDQSSGLPASLFDEKSFTVTANNLAPTNLSMTNLLGGALPATIVVAGTLPIKVSFSDPGSADTHQAQIDCGSGPTAVNGGNNVISGFETSCTFATIGLKTIKVTVTDDDGGSVEKSHVLTVKYNFIGFSAPVDRPTTMNVSKAGQAIPLKWQLTDANGAPVTNLTAVDIKISSLSCGGNVPTDLIEEYASGASGLKNMGGGSYQFNWKTPNNYSGTCKNIGLDFGSGYVEVALAVFNFKS